MSLRFIPKRTEEETLRLSSEILQLKEKKNIIILAHYYQELEIQDLADLVGDSLGLSKAARDIKQADMIVFAGVYFMAETAKILNPEIKVLIPNLYAGCPLADQCDASMIENAKKLLGENIPVVVYINTTAETKAVADVTCTSSNAATIVKNLKVPKVFFGPDSNLAAYVQRKVPDVEIIPIPKDGHCYVHKKFNLDRIKFLKERYPEAEILAHPECNSDVQNFADYVGSTSGMINYGRESKAKTMIVATEKGLIDRMNRDNPDKTFILAEDTAICKNMKKITLENLRDALKYEQFDVNVSPEIQFKAEKAINRMFELL